MKFTLTILTTALFLFGCSSSTDHAMHSPPVLDPSSPTYFSQRLRELSRELDSPQTTSTTSKHSNPYYSSSADYSPPATQGVPFFLIDLASRSYNLPLSSETISFFNQQWANALLGVPADISDRYLLHLIRSTISGLP